jgi:hypothetical protein
MLRKTILIAACVAIIPFSGLKSQDLLIPTNPNRFVINEMQNAQDLDVKKIDASKHKDAPKGKQDKTNRLVYNELGNTVASISQIEKPAAILNLPETSCCNLDQINSRQILISTANYKGEIILRILDSKGKFVYNEVMHLDSNIYFDLNFLSPGKYKAIVMGAGFTREISISI